MSDVKIAASLLASNFKNLHKEIVSVEKFGCEYLHFDVMDGHFVNNISFGVPVLESISHIHHMTNDVHLMIFNPSDYVEAFIHAGANIITFHYEAVKEEEIQPLIDKIHALGAKAGLSIKPETKVDVVLPYLDSLDLVLVMSVEPGFGGQEFIPSSLDKIKTLRKKIDKGHYNTLIEVDGGINQERAKECTDAGVDILVAGNYIFSANKKQAIRSLKG
ncbi:MAG: ribulose-phosphate 3-epimerase [Coprobacillus sp.]|nr:ribulose-phosphate 3-epimerase [Coprobacillus sp.]